MHTINYCLFTLLLLAGFASADASNLHSPDELKEDFRQLYEKLENASYDLYAHTPKATFQSYFDAELEKLDKPLTTLEAHKLFMRFTALAQIAHTKIDFPIQALREYLSSGGKLLPLSVSIRGHAVYVDDYYGTSDSVSAGDEILTVNGVDAAVWIAELQHYVAADNDYLRDGVTEQSFAPLVWLHHGEQAEYSLRLRRKNTGEIYSLKQPTLAFEQHSDGIRQPHEGSSGPAREYKIIDGVGYLKPGPFYNIEEGSGDDTWNTQFFEKFIDDAFSHFVREGVDNILIDLRNNPGGSNSFSDLMIAWFAERPFKFASDFKIKVSELSRQANTERLENSANPSDINGQLDRFYGTYKNGEIVSFPLTETPPNRRERNIAHLPVAIYALIDKTSYSNAVSVAAIIQDYEFGLVLGQETADLATTYASIEHFTLKNTGIQVAYPKALIVRPNGDTEPSGVVPDQDINSLDQALDYIKSQ
ncbi:S41 family peptidase [Pseudidiomarina terrestris]|uniref:S41 family peptidase n=1 Tax=Pseudidiomarina terrestris TaxID=2820060 RepID=UPI0026572F9D|nr:S41 family peptidase [Pseudidiomarina sp. 1ASP75-5]MDN7134902.1 hypothetical protein [Pseudidiomarina sp. 1ASP75-5]